MKKFILIILGIVLLGCCSADKQDSKEGVLITKTYIQAHHTEDCQGHEVILGCIEFQKEGHDMWLFFKDGDGVSTTPSSGIGVVHSPNCKLCHPESESTVEETTSASDYWGW